VDGAEKHHHDTKNRIVDCGFIGFFMPWAEPDCADWGAGDRFLIKQD
jgi:hypothetical protein